MKEPHLDMYDNDIIKWKHDGKSYCLHIRNDDTPLDPRKDWDNITIMACWHRRYNLGDDIGNQSQEEFWQGLVRKYLTEEEILDALKSGKIEGIRFEEQKDDPDYVDIYETYSLVTVVGRSEPGEVLEYEGVHKSCIVSYIMDDLEVFHCQELLEPYLEWMPLWLYDHSGITMSCGARTGQYADRWDSGCVGWIVMTKQQVENNWGKDVAWRDKAIEVMKSDVDIYDKYLTGDVYGFILYEAHSANDRDEPEWEETDSCWGFFGSDIVDSGIVDQVGLGLKEAIQSGEYEEGEAELRTISYYVF